MITTRLEGIILEKTEHEFENDAVLNPGCIEVDGITHLFYRAVQKGNFSSIGYAQLKDNKIMMRLDHPLLFPEHPYESHGLEDPRIVFLDGTYYLFYTAYDGRNALVAYATSPDLVHFTKQGVITPNIHYHTMSKYFDPLKLHAQYHKYITAIPTDGPHIALWEKDAFIFPKKFDGKFALIHRIRPGIQIIFFKDFTELTTEYWSEYFRNLNDYLVIEPTVRDGSGDIDTETVGGGCPPIETPEGWLMIYHTVSGEGTPHRVYRAAVALLDKDDPRKIIGQLPYPLFEPTEPWETESIEMWKEAGNFASVVFPSGAVVRDGRIYIYYGAADQRIACRSVDLQELLHELKNSKPTA